MVPFRTAREAVDLLHRCLEDGAVAYGTHFREELANESLSIGDAWVVLRTGRIYDPPEQDIKTGDWKYRVEGRVPDGTRIAIVFCFKSLEKVFLITVFSIERKEKGTR